MSSSHTPPHELPVPEPVPEPVPVPGEPRPSGDVRVVTAGGEIDHHTHGPLKDALETAATTHRVVVLDASEVTFGDSVFLNLLLRVHSRTELRIAAPADQFLRLMEITGTDDVLRVYPDVRTAVQAA